MDWLDLLAVQRTLNSLLHHQSSKASIVLYPAVITVQLSHPYMTTGKTITSRPTFVGWSWHPSSSFLSLSISHPHTQSFIRALALECPLQGSLRSLRMDTKMSICVIRWYRNTWTYFLAIPIVYTRGNWDYMLQKTLKVQKVEMETLW